MPWPRASFPPLLKIGIRLLPELVLDRRFRSLARPPLHVSLLGRLSRPPPPSRYWLLRKRRNLLIQDRLSILLNLVFHSLVIFVVVAIIVWRKPVNADIGGHVHTGGRHSMRAEHTTHRVWRGRKCSRVCA
jgi:hypothetical protein